MKNDIILFNGAQFVVSQNDHGSVRLAARFGAGVQFPRDHTYASVFRGLQTDSECERVLSLLLQVPVIGDELPQQQTNYLLQVDRAFYMRVKALHFFLPHDPEDVFRITHRASCQVLAAMGLRPTEPNVKAISARIRVLDNLVISQSQQQAANGLASFTSKQDTGVVSLEATQIINLVNKSNLQNA